MAFIPVSNCLQVKMIYTLGGQRIQNNLYFTLDHEPTATDRANLATAMHTWWTNQLKPNLTSDIALVEIDVLNLSSSSAPGTQLFISPAEAGTLSATVGMPSGSALVATFRTDLRGRNYRGRNYVGGLSGNALTSPTTYNTTQIANIISAFAWLMDTAHTALFIWSVVSKFVNKAPRSTGIKIPVTAVTMDSALDSQRRRLLGRGR
jgi:hypothetical protein